MTQSEIKTLFNKVYKGSKNFMTPYVEKYRARNGYVFEISSGPSMFENKRMFGVTVLTTSGNKCHELNEGGFESLALADEYIDSI